MIAVLSGWDSIAVIVGAVALVAVAAIGRGIAVRVGAISVQLDGVENAVNHVRPGEPTLIDQVREIRSSTSQIQARLAEGERRFDQIETQLADDGRHITEIEARLDRLEADQPDANT